MFIPIETWMLLPSWVQFFCLGLGARPVPARTRAARMKLGLRGGAR